MDVSKAFNLLPGTSLFLRHRALRIFCKYQIPVVGNEYFIGVSTQTEKLRLSCWNLRMQKSTTATNSRSVFREWEIGLQTLFMLRRQSDTRKFSPRPRNDRLECNNNCISSFWPRPLGSIDWLERPIFWQIQIFDENKRKTVYMGNVNLNQ